MSELTPRNLFSYPSEREEPFYTSFKDGMIAEDAAHWANADNGNLVYFGGGVFNWDQPNNLLWWTENIYVSGYTTPWRAIITGPRSVTIQENEVIYFQMPRLVQNQDAVISVMYRSSRVFLEGVRLHDIRIFCVRTGDTLYFANGKSLKAGDTGPLFGAGIGVPSPIIIPHKHAVAALITPPPGTTLLNPLPVYIAPELARDDVFRNGQLLVEGVTEDYTVNLLTGEITLTVPSILLDKFIVWRELRDTAVPATTHTHAPKLLYTPLPGTVMLATLIVSPFLARVDVFKNGQLLVEGATHDYTVDFVLGIITLNVASVVLDKFEIHREIA